MSVPLHAVPTTRGDWASLFKFLIQSLIISGDKRLCQSLIASWPKLSMTPTVSSSQLEPGNTTTPNFIFFISNYIQKYAFLLNF
jgi:hypothetical protein